MILLNKEIGYKTNIQKYYEIFWYLFLRYYLLLSYEIFHIINTRDFHKAINISSIISVTLAFNFFNATIIISKKQDL